MNGYLIQSHKDSDKQDSKHYWVLIRVVESCPSEQVCKGSLGEIALYLWDAFRKNMNGVVPQKKVNELMPKFSRPLPHYKQVKKNEIPD